MGVGREGKDLDCHRSGILNHAVLGKSLYFRAPIPIPVKPGIPTIPCRTMIIGEDLWHLWK